MTTRTVRDRVRAASRTILALWALLALHPARARGDANHIVFVVNQQNPYQSVSVRDLIDFYEKKKRTWPDGTPVRFIDWPSGTPEKEKFLSEILGMSESDVDLFWFQQRLRNGDSMPIQVGSSELVLEMVRSFKGAIGYLLSSAPIGRQGVKPIKVSDSTRK